MTPLLLAAASVLVVTLDTTRADHLGCYGAKQASTPSIDALATAGARFDQALSPAPLTFPSHATIFTGRLPRHHGVRDNALFRLKKDVPVLAESFRKAGYRTGAFVSAAVLDGSLGLDRGFDVYDDTLGPAARGEEPERRGDKTADAAIAFVAKAKPPFFVWVHLYDPHAPYTPSYDGEISFMDAQVGRLAAAARARDASVLITLAGDHGESLGEHGEDTHGIFLYQATQRVPLVVFGPGITAGRVVRETVGLVDVAPTLADLAGIAPLAGADGRSLAPVLRGGAAPPARDVEMESFFPLFSYGWAPLRALVRGPLKLIDAPKGELYDLSKDPAEAKNVRMARRNEANDLFRALSTRVEGDAPVPEAMDPSLAEHAQRIASLGYVGGSTANPNEEAIDPKDGIVWIADLEIGRNALASKKPADGIAPLTRLLARNPQNLPALMTLAACFEDAGKLDDAIGVHRRALALYPKSAITWKNLGGALAAKGSKTEAAAAFEKAVALDPLDAVALHELSRLAFERKD
ncbi:MAG TPA: sulfatase-like hydrolase/transferase, partial [Candidatus Polarisedimenticolaceae bacterium]|nr:sulfatase-like hydrolase/transferase [Candidatus Polarisedimenticolaceae bacterium]